MNSVLRDRKLVEVGQEVGVIHARQIVHKSTHYRAANPQVDARAPSNYTQMLTSADLTGAERQKSNAIKAECAKRAQRPFRFIHPRGQQRIFKVDAWPAEKVSEIPCLPTCFDAAPPASGADLSNAAILKFKRSVTPFLCLIYRLQSDTHISACSFNIIGHENPGRNIHVDSREPSFSIMSRDEDSGSEAEWVHGAEGRHAYEKVFQTFYTKHTRADPRYQSINAVFYLDYRNPQDYKTRIMKIEFYPPESEQLLVGNAIDFLYVHEILYAKCHLEPEDLWTETHEIPPPLPRHLSRHEEPVSESESVSSLVSESGRGGYRLCTISMNRVKTD